MRNLKRALSLALASVMLLGMMVTGANALSFEDADDITNVTAATILQEIGVMVGDGTNFYPDQVVTRAEMAVIVCTLLYGEKLNVNQFTASKFTDVPEGHWANGYVNLANSLNIIVGYGDGTFGPNDPVTTAQASLMLTKALGYYQNNELIDDWAQDSLTIITKATQLSMFEGIVPPTANEGLTRDNVAVMTFNTLTRATPVQFNSIVNEYFTVGGSLTSGVEYIDAYEFGKPDYEGNEYSHTLGYTIYGLYIKEDHDTDDFNRPGAQWAYEKGGIIGTFSNEPVAVFTEQVTSKALYEAIGKTAVDNYSDWNVSLNGVDINYTSKMLNDNKTDDNDDFYEKAGGVALTDYDGSARKALTGNGVITEVYVDGTKKNDRRVDIVIIDTFAAEVYSVKSNGKITLADLDKGPVETSDEFEATGFEEDEVVVYTYANKKIQTVESAEKIEGRVTRVRANTSDSNGDNFNVDSTTYKYNRNMFSDRLTTENVGNNTVAYLDANGFVVYIDESAVTYDYAYLLSANADDDVYGGGVTIYARLVLADGTIKKVETDAKENEFEDNNVAKNMIVSYSSDKNNVYTLTQKDYDNGKSTKGTAAKKGDTGTIELALAPQNIFKNGRATFIVPGGDTYTADSNTVVIVADSESKKDDYNFSVYTGVKNIPDIDARVTGKNTKIDIAADEKNVAKVVYIEDADVSGVGDVIYIRADSGAKKVLEEGDNKYFEISAVVDGKVDTLKVKEGSDAAGILVDLDFPEDTTSVKISDTKYIVAAKSITVDGNGMVTNVKFFDPLGSGDGSFGSDDTGRSVGTGAAKKDVVTLGGTSHPWIDAVTSVRYNIEKGEFSVTGIRAVKDDTNDKWLAVADDYSLTGLCIVEVKGGEGSGSSSGDSETPGTYNITVKVNGTEDTSLSKTGVANGDYTITYDVPANTTATYKINGGTAVAVPEDGKISVTVNGANVTVEIMTEAAGATMYELTLGGKLAVAGEATVYAGGKTVKETNGVYKIAEGASVTVYLTGDLITTTASTGYSGKTFDVDGVPVTMTNGSPDTMTFKMTKDFELALVAADTLPIPPVQVYVIKAYGGITGTWTSTDGTRTKEMTAEDSEITVSAGTFTLKTNGDGKAVVTADGVAGNSVGGASNFYDANDATLGNKQISVSANVTLFSATPVKVTGATGDAGTNGVKVTSASIDGVSFQADTGDSDGIYMPVGQTLTIAKLGSGTCTSWIRTTDSTAVSGEKSADTFTISDAKPVYVLGAWEITFDDGVKAYAGSDATGTPLNSSDYVSASQDVFVTGANANKAAVIDTTDKGYGEAASATAAPLAANVNYKGYTKISVDATIGSIKLPGDAFGNTPTITPGGAKTYGFKEGSLIQIVGANTTQTSVQVTAVGGETNVDADASDASTKITEITTGTEGVASTSAPTATIEVAGRGLSFKQA